MSTPSAPEGFIQLNKIQEETFENKTLSVDGNLYIKCTFTECRLVFKGMAMFDIVDCDFNNCTWSLEGAAAATVSSLRNLNRAGAFELIESLISTIRGDVSFTVR